MLNCPVDVVDFPETTVLGAEMFTFFGAGQFDSPLAAQQAMKPRVTRVEPSENSQYYK